MSYPSGSDINNCHQPPSKGGLSMPDLKAFATSIGVDPKGLLKTQLCDLIKAQLQKSSAKTNAIPPKAKTPIKVKTPIKTKSPIQLPTPIKTKISMKHKKIESDCPVSLQPQNGQCPPNYPFQFQTQSGLPCCYKQPALKTPKVADKFKKPLTEWMGNAISIVAKKKVQPTSIFTPLDGDYYLALIKQYYDKAPKSTVFNTYTMQKLYDMYVQRKLFMPCPDLFCNNFPNHGDCKGLYKNIRRVFFAMETFNRGINIKNLSDETACQLYNDQLPSSDWIQAQIKYTKGLSQAQKDVIALYSHGGDDAINTYLRKNHNLNLMDSTIKIKMPSKFDNFKSTLSAFLGQEVTSGIDPILTDDNINKYCQYLCNQLTEVVTNAPKTDREFVVLRGIETNNYMIGTSDIYANNGFVSTSLRSVIALRFAKSKTQSNAFNYMNLITIPKGYSCFLNSDSVYAAEFEIILPDQSKFKVINQFQAKDFVVDDVLVNSYAGEPGKGAKIVSIPTNHVQLII